MSTSRQSGTSLDTSSLPNDYHASYACVTLSRMEWPRRNSRRSNASSTSLKLRACTAKRRSEMTPVSALASDTSSSNSYSAASASSVGVSLNPNSMTHERESSRNGNCLRLRPNSKRSDRRITHGGWRTGRMMSTPIATAVAAPFLKAPVRTESIAPFVRSARAPCAPRAPDMSFGLLAAFMVGVRGSSTTVSVRREMRKPASLMLSSPTGVCSLLPVERISPSNPSARLRQFNAQLMAYLIMQCLDSMASRPITSKS